MSERPRVEEALAAMQGMQRSIMAVSWGRWADLDLTIRQVKALHVLGECGGCSVGALAERQGTKLPAASILADNLVHHGLVERSDDPEDRRRVLLRLTPSGEEVVRRPKLIAELMRTWMEEMDDEDLSALTRGLQALSEVSARASAESRQPSRDPGAGAPDPARPR